MAYQIHFYTYNQFYFKQFSLVKVQFFVYSQVNVKTVLFQTIQFRQVKWFQVLLCITNNSIKYLSLIYTLLDVKKNLV